jgi:hypothetical protein
MKKRDILLCIPAVLLTFVLIISCGSDDNGTYPITITPILIEGGEHFGGVQGNFVIKTQAELNNLMCHRSEFWVDSIIAACYQYWAEKNINFDNFQIIAVIDENRPQTGWDINITSIKEYPDNIVVSIGTKAIAQLGNTDRLRREVLVFIMPDSLELAPGLEGGASVQESDIRSQQLRETLLAINVISIARAFPDWDAADSIVYNDRGYPVRRPDFHRVFTLTFGSEQEADEAVRQLSSLPSVAYAERNMNATLDNDPRYLDGTQWQPFQIVKIPVTAKEVVFRYVDVPYPSHR